MPDIAAFDFDGTLTTGGSVFDFLAALTGRRKLATASLALLPQLAHAAVVGGEVADRTKERLFEMVLAGIETSAFDEVSREFAQAHLAGHLRVEVHRRLQLHQQRGDHTVIVSASPESYIAEAARRLGADQALATRLASRDGRLTGRYDGKNCRGEEKLRRLREWTGRLDGPPARLWVYGNSRGDLRMMRAADVGVNVGRLGAFGRLRDFPGLAATPVTE
jgi:phosphatidylglycerophosphatase C